VRIKLIEIAQLIVSVIALGTGAVGANVAYQTLSHGSIPTKHMSAWNSTAIDILDDLRNASDAVTTSVLDAKGNNINNLYSASTYLVNNGNAPIVPADYDGKVRLTKKDPWSIIMLKNLSDNGAPEFIWHRVSNTEFDADPILINPGDNISVNLYLTSSDPKPNTDVLPMVWNARIANLSQIEYPLLLANAQSNFPELLPVRVDYVGNNLLLFLLVFTAYLSVYAYALSVFGYMSSVSRTTVYTVVASIFGLATTDATITYIDTRSYLINHWLNAPLLLGNFVILGWIAFQLYRRVRQVDTDTIGLHR
jgi:hypothetical protein